MYVFGEKIVFYTFCLVSKVVFHVDLCHTASERELLYISIPAGESWVKIICNTIAKRILPGNVSKRYFGEKEFCDFLAVLCKRILIYTYQLWFTSKPLKRIFFCIFWCIDCVCTININKIFTSVNNIHTNPSNSTHRVSVINQYLMFVPA